MNKKQTKYIKILAIATFIYFGIRFILSLILPFLEGYVEEIGMVNVIFSPLLALLGIYFGYQLLKKKRWALIGIIVLIAYHAITRYVITSSLGDPSLPIVQIAYLLFLVGGLKQFK